MGGLSRYDKDRAVNVYERHREITADGVYVKSSKRYEEFYTEREHDDFVDAEVLPNNNYRRKSRNRKEPVVEKTPEKLDNLTFIVLMNTICMFFVLIVIFIKAIFSF